jgi:hypothetical protein
MIALTPEPRPLNPDETQLIEYQIRQAEASRAELFRRIERTEDYLRLLRSRLPDPVALRRQEDSTSQLPVFADAD